MKLMTWEFPQLFGMRSLLGLWVVLLLSGCDSFVGLRRGDPQVPVDVIYDAARCADPTLTDSLVAILEGRADAVASGESGSAEETLAPALAAAVAVGDRGDRSAVPVLIRLLADPDGNLRANGVEALWLIGGVEAMAALESVLWEEQPLVVQRRWRRLVR